MEISLWLKDSISKTNIPNWPWPICNHGLLKLSVEQFHFRESKLSQINNANEEWEPEYIRYRFIGTLECNNCNDFIAFLGTGNVEHENYYDNYKDEYFEEYIDIFYPKYFYPPLKLFIINCKCPESIKKEIEDSFSHYWSDLPSCANKIRASLEMLMNQQKVGKTIIQNGKREKMTLHRRIEIFGNSNPEVAEFLLAIKWIGNTGSHIGKLERIDILEAYELLEHSINMLFDDTDIKLKKITKEINKRKGTRIIKD